MVIFEKRLVLVRHLVSLNEANGRPAQQLRLPPDWSEQGWWVILEHSPEALKLGHRGSDKVVEVTLAQLGLAKGAPFLAVTVNQNYSMRRATLVDATGTKSKQCYNLYLVAMKEEPTIKTAVKLDIESASKRRRATVSAKVANGRDEATEVPPPPIGNGDSMEKNASEEYGASGDDGDDCIMGVS